MAEPDLEHLRAFALVARRESFRAAARERGVSASTLSGQVRALEERLGVLLLNRTTRSVRPTEAGERLLRRLAPALADIAAALDGLAAEEDGPAGTLRINAPPPAIELALAPLVPLFLAAHPRVRLEVVAETAPVDIVAGGFDAGVRWEEALAQDMVAVPLSGPQRYAVVAAPALVERMGAPETPEDLLSRPAIRVVFPSGVRPPWEFERGGRTVRLAPEGPLVTTSIPLQLAAARAGLGFYLSFEEYVREDLAAGRLVEVLAGWCPPFPGPRLYYPRGRHTPAPLRAFVEFVRRRRTGARG